MTRNPNTKIVINTDVNFWRMAPGNKRNESYIWNELRKENRIGYEWCKSFYGDLNKLTIDTYHKLSWQKGFQKKHRNFQQTKYFHEVKTRDYVCIISGREFLGIARVLQGYRYPEAQKHGKYLEEYFTKHNLFPFQTVKVKWIRQFEKPKFLTNNVIKAFTLLNNRKQWNAILRVLKNEGFRLTNCNDENVKKVGEEEPELTGYDKKRKRVLKEHLGWERDQSFVRRFKKKHKNTGCFACKFKTDEFYKIRTNSGVLELHHIEPLHTKRAKKVKLSEKNVALLCPNCHRAIHKVMAETINKLVLIKDFKKRLLWTRDSC